jgi:serine/threonine protein kinase/Tol biopolymer transport system component
MDHRRWQQIEALFNSALNLSAPERKSFLESACGSDPELRAEVDSLLSETERPTELLDQPAFSLGLSLLNRDQTKSLRGEQFGVYTIISPIGRGGMGEVYLAQDERLGRQVALKLLPALLTENLERVRRFQHEARAASAVSHPNVAHVYEIGEANGRLFTAMEFVQGVTLRRRLAIEPITLGEALDIASQTAAAIAAAHQSGIIHRDIKPENIMIRSDRLVKVVDFGLAKLTDPESRRPGPNSYETQVGVKLTGAMHTEPGVLMGTANYMSPEQARAQQVDARTDIWSWGVILYEMLAGQPPFTGATSSDIIAEILKTQPALLEVRTGTILPDLKNILRKALAKEPDHRYASMADAIHDLQTVKLKLERAGALKLQLPLSAEARIWKSSFFERRAGVNSAWWQVTPWKIVGATCLVLAVALSLTYLHYRSRPKISAPAELVKLFALGNVLDAVISPDGKSIAYVKREAGHYALRVRQLASGSEQELLPEAEALCWGLRFSHEGGQLYYIITERNSTISVLYRIAISGGAPAKLVVNIDTPIALSPDGVRLAFYRRYLAERKDVLIVADADGTDEVQLATRKHPDSFSFSSEAWSPDGELIACGLTNTSENSFKVVGVRVKDGQLIELTPREWTATRGFVWSSDGRNLIFSAGTKENGNYQLWRLSYPAGDVLRLTDGQTNYEDVSLTSDGKTLLAMETGRRASLWTANLSNGTARQLSSEERETIGLSLLPTREIVYAKKEFGLPNIWLLGTDGRTQRQLTTEGAIHPAVSPGAHSLAFTATSGGARHVWTMDLSSGKSQQLTNGSGEDFPAYTPDGKAVIYTSLSADRYTLWRVPLTGGPAEQLTRIGFAADASISPDGKFMACAYRADVSTPWKIALLPIAGGEPTRILSVPYAFNQTVRWSRDAQSLLYVDSPKGVSNIWRLNLSDNKSTQLTSFGDQSIFAYDLSTDGSYVVTGRGVIKREVVLLKNPL